MILFILHRTRARSFYFPLVNGTVCGKFCKFRTPGTLPTRNPEYHRVLASFRQGEVLPKFRLRFFGHLARSAPEEDHHRVIAAALRPPTDWRRPAGHPRATWLRTIDEDVQPLNFGVHTAWRRQERGILGNKSSVRQRCARSSPPRRRIHW